MNNEGREETMFVPYGKIIIGSNEISCRYLVDINGFHPIVIAKGEVPHIWLKTIVRGKEVTLVDDNKDSFERIKVIIDNSKKEISILLEENTNSEVVILYASYKSEDTFNIKKMNLTPIGLSMISNEKELVIGNNHLSGNVVVGVEAFIGLSI